MRLPPELAAALAAGDGVLVPDVARATAVRLAWSDAQVAAGLAAWDTPDVLTPHAWLHDTARRARTALLSHALEWQVLRELAASDAGLASANIQADVWQRSLQQIRDHGVAWRHVAACGTPETDILLRAKAALEDFGRRRGNLTAPSLYVPAAGDWGRPRLAFGFGRLPATFTAATVLPAPAELAARASISRHVAHDPADEMALAVGWAAARLTRSAHERLLLLVPNEFDYEPALQRALADNVRLEAGREHSIFLDRRAPLAAAPPVRALLFWLRLLTQSLPVVEICSGLRLHAAGMESLLAAASIADRIARRCSSSAGFHDIERLCDERLRMESPAVAKLLTDLRAAAEVLTGKTMQGSLAERISAASSKLTVRWDLGLGDGGFALQRAWQEVLIEFADLSAGQARTPIGEAVSLLAARADRTSWPQGVGDQRLTILRTYHDPIVRYDGLWAAGLSASQWPAAAAADGWLPRSLQLAAGMPGADASGQLTEARRQLTSWQTAASELHLSHPGRLDDHAASPSLLVVAWPASELTEARAIHGNAIIAAAAPKLESYLDDHYHRAVQGEISSGAQRIDSFHACPFRGSAELRFEIEDRRQPSPGLDAAASGSALHHALQLVWTRLKNSAGLNQLTETALSALVREHVSTAVEWQLGKLSRDDPWWRDSDPAIRHAMRTVEIDRITAMLTKLMTIERSRVAFQVEHLEQTFRLEMAGLQLQLRIDRIDSLGNTSGISPPQRVLIDYKSGSAGLPRWTQSPARELQLLVYREALVTAGQAPAALLAWQIGNDRIRAAGAMAPNVDLPTQLRPRADRMPDWQQGQAQWSQWVQDAADGLARGESRITPLPVTCRYCELAALCRRHERSGSLTDDDDESADAEAEAS